MRLLILAAGSALILTACGDDSQSENAQNADAGLTAESIVANDVTAIDAVTADAANMAADVDINFTNDMLEPSAPSARRTEPSGSRRPAGRTEAGPRPEPAEPAANTTSNAAEQDL